MILHSLYVLLFMQQFWIYTVSFFPLVYYNNNNAVFQTVKKENVLGTVNMIKSIICMLLCK